MLGFVSQVASTSISLLCVKVDVRKAVAGPDGVSVPDPLRANYSLSPENRSSGLAELC